MLKLLKYELLKVVTKKLFWGFLFICILLNIAILWQTNKPDQLSPSFSETKSFYDTLRKMSDQDKLYYLGEQKEQLKAVLLKEQIENEQIHNTDSEALEYMQSIYAPYYEKYKEILDEKQDYMTAARKQTLVDFVSKEIITNDSYKEYLDKIESDATRLLGVSIFQSSIDGFSKLNVEKTAADYAAMRNTTIEYDTNKGLTLLFNSPATDIVIILILIMLCFALITDEKDKRLFHLVKSTRNGTLQTVKAKIMALFVLAFGINMLLAVTNIAFSGFTYGLGELSRSIQSVPDMVGSTLNLSVVQYFGLFFAVKTIGVFIAGLIIFLFAIHSKHPITMLLLTTLTAGGSILLTYIPVLSAFNWFKYINFAVLIQPHSALKSYLNLNLAGRPVNILLIVAVFSVFMLIMLLILNCITFVNKRGLESEQSFLKTIAGKISKLSTIFARYHSGYTFFEFKKIAFINKALLVLVLFATFQGYWSANQTQYFSPDEYYYKFYMNRLEGKLTESKETLLLSEKEKFDEAQYKYDEIIERYNNREITMAVMVSELKPYEKILSQVGAFLPIYERYEYIKAHSNAEFLYDKGYERLFGIIDADEGLNSGIKLLVVLIFCLCGVFSIEYKSGMYKVLNASKKGIRETVTSKLGVSILTALIIYAIAYIPDLIFIGKFYGFGGLNFPLVSLPAFSGFGQVPIWFYITLLFTLRLLVCVCVAFIVLCFSLIVKNNILAALCAVLAFLAPLFIHIMGISFFDNISMLQLLTINNMFIGLPVWRSIIQCAVFVGTAIISLLFLYKKFGKLYLLKKC